MQASDQALPEPKTSVIVVTVNVPRDKTPPTFSNVTFSTRIVETQRVNSTFFTLRATDPDLRVIFYNYSLYN